MKLPPFFEEDHRLVDAELERLLPAENERPSLIHQAMRYSVFAGGKRVRPILCIEAFRIFSDETPTVLPVACAMEFIHTYSLIHDDLPALDNDDLRRGRPTCHKKFGEAMAILAGDALLTLAFEALAGAPVQQAERVALIREVASAAGTREGMVGGQVADLEAEGKDVTPEMLEYIHRSKTAALIRASILSGAIAGGVAGVSRGGCRGGRRSWRSFAGWSGWARHVMRAEQEAPSGDGRHSGNEQAHQGPCYARLDRTKTAKSDLSGALWSQKISV